MHAIVVLKKKEGDEMLDDGNNCNLFAIVFLLGGYFSCCVWEKRRTPFDFSNNINYLFYFIF
jgi:hypothetical protein